MNAGVLLVVLFLASFIYTMCPGDTFLSQVMGPAFIVERVLCSRPPHPMMLYRVICCLQPLTMEDENMADGNAAVFTHFQ